jgi:oligopeptidase B
LTVVRSVESSASQPPVAERGTVTHEHHGVRRTDPYAWMRDTTDPRMLANLEAEAAYYRVATDHLRSKVRTLSGEMTSRVPAADSSVSFRRLRFSYYTRTPTGREYAQLCRHVGRFDARDPSGATDSVVLLDPQDLKGESPYVDLGLTLVSPDERLLAYSVDTTGDEVYRLRFRDLESLEDLPDEIPRSYYSGAWSADASTFFYTVHDAAYRPHQVWRHRVGTAAADDVLVLEETDQQFDLEVRGCRSGDVVLVTSASRDTTEVWWLDAHRPDRPATCVQPRSKGREYRCEHARTPAGDLLLVVTNDDAEEFRLAAAPLSDCGRDRWRTLVAEDPDERLYEVTAFEGHVVTSLRRAGRLMARAYRLTADGDLALPALDIAPEDAAGTLELADNEWFPARSITVV